MDYSNIRIVNQPLDPALGWTTINQGPNSIQVPPPPRPPFSGPGAGSNQVPPPPRPPFSGPGAGNNQVPPPPRPPFSGPGMGNNQGTPPSPPPSFTPKKNQGQVSTFAIDSGSIRGCLYRWVYIWPSRSNRGFWLYLTYVGRRSVAGFRTSRWGYSYYGMDVNQIDSFQCY